MCSPDVVNHWWCVPHKLTYILVFLFNVYILNAICCWQYVAKRKEIAVILSNSINNKFVFQVADKKYIYLFNKKDLGWRKTCSFCGVYNTVYSVHSTVCIVKCTLYSVKCFLLCVGYEWRETGNTDFEGYHVLGHWSWCVFTYKVTDVYHE